MASFLSIYRPSSDEDDDEASSFNTIDTEVMGTNKLRRGLLVGSASDDDDDDPDEDENEKKMKHVAALKAGRTLCRMRAGPPASAPDVVATGGKENDLQVWDLNRIGMFVCFCLMLV